jgi:hypothetical protein
MATDDAEIEETYDEPQKANPFASLPKSSMNLDACKKAFFNARTEGTNYFESLFWTTYDPTGFSIHLGKYKYNGDLSGMDFVRRNTVGGMVQSMDSSLDVQAGWGHVQFFKVDDRSAEVCLPFFATVPYFSSCPDSLLRATSSLL